MTTNVFDQQCLNFMLPQAYALLRYVLIYICNCLSNTLDHSSTCTFFFFFTRILITDRSIYASNSGPNNPLIIYNNSTKSHKCQIYLILNFNTQCYLDFLCLLGNLYMPFFPICNHEDLSLNFPCHIFQL